MSGGLFITLFLGLYITVFVLVALSLRQFRSLHFLNERSTQFAVVLMLLGPLLVKNRQGSSAYVINAAFVVILYTSLM